MNIVNTCFPECEHADHHQLYFTNIKNVCSNCGLIYDKEYRHPWLAMRGTKRIGRPKGRKNTTTIEKKCVGRPKKQEENNMFSNIDNHKKEYENLLGFLNKRKLYLVHKTKIEMLFFNLFGLLAGKPT